MTHHLEKKAFFATSFVCSTGSICTCRGSSSTETTVILSALSRRSSSCWLSQYPSLLKLSMECSSVSFNTTLWSVPLGCLMVTLAVALFWTFSHLQLFLHLMHLIRNNLVFESESVAPQEQIYSKVSNTSVTFPETTVSSDSCRLSPKGVNGSIVVSSVEQSTFPLPKSQMEILLNIYHWLRVTINVSAKLKWTFAVVSSRI